MVLQLATRIEDVGKRLGFAEQKKTVESLLKQQWPEEGERASKMFAAAQQTNVAAFDWIETMMKPLLEAYTAEAAEQRMQEEQARVSEEDRKRGSMPAGFFQTLKGADRRHNARVGNLDDVRQGLAPPAPRMDRFYTP